VMALWPIGTIAADSRFTWVDEKYDEWITLGRFLGQHESGAFMAIDAAGKIPFYSRLRSLDMLGLSDYHIARMAPRADGHQVPGHNKYDPDYVLASQPDLVVDWIFGDGSLAWGLTRQKLDRAGYHIKYLLSTVKQAKPADSVIDVSGIQDLNLDALTKQGYRHAVLTRRSPPRLDAQGTRAPSSTTTLPPLVDSVVAARDL